MQADFSRRTFDPLKHFSAVLSQQGRVQLDADFNEQAAILLHQLRTVVADVVGHAAAPEAAAGFAIERFPADNTTKLEDLRISPGRLYADGILVENDLGVPQDSSTWASYWNQPDGYLDLENTGDRLPETGLPFVVYLRVWERLITVLQDPAIREVALGDPGPDTAARSKVVWQVAKFLVNKDSQQTPADQFTAFLKKLNPNPGLLAARAKHPDPSDQDTCHLPPEARFRGLENQFYRVEVHTGGEAWQDVDQSASHQDVQSLLGATFTWSRENASVVFPIVSISGAEVELATLGRDGKLALEVGDRVELVDDATAARVADDVLPTDEPTAAPSLRQVIAIDPAARRVTLDAEMAADCGPGSRPELHPLLRRWDHSSPTGYEKGKRQVAADGALPLVEGEWIDLEDGVQVRFKRRSGDGYRPGTYRRGDYWQIPARTITGDVEWPQDENGPKAVRAHGVEYHYASLAVVTADGSVTEPRLTFKSQTAAAQAAAEQAPAAKPVASGQPKPRTAQSTRRSSGGGKESGDV